MKKDFIFMIVVTSGVLLYVMVDIFLYFKDRQVVKREKFETKERIRIVCNGDEQYCINLARKISKNKHPVDMVFQENKYLDGNPYILIGKNNTSECYYKQDICDILR